MEPIKAMLEQQGVQKRNIIGNANDIIVISLPFCAIPYSFLSKKAIRHSTEWPKVLPFCAKGSLRCEEWERINCKQSARW
jgi:hypothetical protein